MIKSKIKTIASLKVILSKFKKKGKTIVFTNGCFDILHLGHVTYLEEAKREGDILVVAVNSDDSIRRLKGQGRPIMNQEERMKILASLESVDYITYFKEDDPALIVKKLDPDVIVKGADWKENKIIGAEQVKRKGGRVVTIPLCRGYSTTTLLEKIKRLR